MDHPDTQRYKLERIKKLEWIIPENLTFVPVDFSKDSLKEKLLEKGFDPNLPTFTAILGVTYYLTLPVFEQTLKIISELSLEGSKLYVTLFPCNECAKAIIQAGIRTLIYADDKYGSTPAVRASKRMLNAAGVRYYQYEKSGREIRIQV